MTAACLDVRPLLEPFDAGELSRAENDAAASHLFGCTSCTRELAEIAVLASQLRGRLAGMEAPAPRTKRWGSVIPFGVAAATFIGIVAMILHEGSAPEGTLKGDFDIAVTADGPWQSLEGSGIPRARALRAKGSASSVGFDDGSSFSFRDGSVFTVVGRRSGYLRLYSGYVRATVPDADRACILHPAGELRSGEGRGGCAVEIDLEPQGGTMMHPTSVVLTLSVIAGAAHLQSDGHLLDLSVGKAVRQGITFSQDGAVTWTDAPQDEVAKFIAEYRKALIDGDGARGGQLFDLIVGKERAAIDEVRKVYGTWERGTASRLGELRQRAARFKEEVMKGGDEKALYELYKADLDDLALLEREGAGLKELTAELLLRESLSKGTPVLDTPVHAIRSFELFGSKGNWSAAAKCLLSGQEKEARALYAIDCSFREGWKEKQTWNAESTWNDQEDIKVTVFGYYNGFNTTEPLVTFPGAEGIATFTRQRDGPYRITGIVKGDHLKAK